MKKNLIALAVLAAAGAASAQSSVTLYGIADVYVGSVKDTIQDTVNTSLLQRQTGVNSSGANNSRWGLRGTEDLGNGLKANFVLESGLAVDTGAAVGDAFGRRAVVGLSGNFGNVELGRNYTAYDTLRGASNNTADLNMSATGDVFKVGGDYTLRTSHSIRFDSANYSGFSGSASYAFGENKTATDDATDIIALHVKYANGPLLVGYAHQTEEKTGTTASTRYNLFAGSYDFGVAKLNAGFNKVDRDGNNEDTEYQVGVSAPFGATTVYFGYAAGKNETAVGEIKRSGFDLVGTYALSKRTTAYAGYKSVEIKDTNSEIKAFGVGVRHAF